MKNEFALIADLLKRRPVFGRDLEVDVGDDAAVIAPEPGRSLVLTTDSMAETVHFLRSTMEPEDIGWKLLASNVSDVAAMGGTPRHALVGVAVGDGWTSGELEKLYAGLYECAEAYKVTVVGGDTVRTPGPLVLHLTLTGDVPRGKALRRSLARPGDVVFVTGTPGDSAAGLDLLLHRPDWSGRYPRLVRAHRRPVPSVEIGRWLMKSGVDPALNDISDGVAREAREIAEASGVRLVLEPERFPLSRELADYAARTGQRPETWVLNGGEDYLLLGTISPAGWEAFREEAGRRNWFVTAIGRAEDGKPGVELEKNGRRTLLESGGYQHFSDG
ncbi:thiamine-phosphate kinase [Staphylospora marina]|uniref:thiamine-phosphate kinase n=1 Tax=Staphylospora marina TaxID=2490858 RepID=UPI000F5BE479|nr:thiamine-phosphate kinase [Staphylospora marina]